MTQDTCYRLAQIGATWQLVGAGEPVPLRDSMRVYALVGTAWIPLLVLAGTAGGFLVQGAAGSLWAMEQIARYEFVLEDGHGTDTTGTR